MDNTAFEKKARAARQIFNMESMLVDGKVVEMMAEVKQKDQSLWQKIRTWFKNLAADLKRVIDAYKGVKPDSLEGRIVADMQDVYAQLQELYTEALVEGAENFTVAKETKNTTGEGGIKMSDRNIPLSQNDFDQYMHTGVTQHTRNKKARLYASGKNPILTTVAEIRSFISDFISGKAVGEVRAFAKVGSRLSRAIREKRNSLDVEGCYIELNADGLREAYKVHSKAKESGDIPLSVEDFERIPDYIDDFDGILAVDTYKNRVEVHLYKEIGNGFVRILTVSSKERSSLQVTKIIGVSREKFETKYGKKIERFTGSLRGQIDNTNASIPSTKAQLTAGDLSKNSIRSDNEKINTKFSLRDPNAARTAKALERENARLKEDVQDFPCADPTIRGIFLLALRVWGRYTESRKHFRKDGVV